MFSYSGTRFGGQSISAALRRFIIMLLCHTFLLLSENCSFSDVVVGHIVVLAMFLINFAAHADIKEKRHDAVLFHFCFKNEPSSGTWCEQDETKQKESQLRNYYKHNEGWFVGFGGVVADCNQRNTRRLTYLLVCKKTTVLGLSISGWKHGDAVDSLEEDSLPL